MRRSPAPRDRVRYIAFGLPRDGPIIALDTPIFDWAKLRASLQLLMKIYKPRVAYALLPPAALAEACRHPRGLLGTEVEQVMEGFVAAYEGGPKMGPWRMGDWEYYEVPVEEVKTIKGYRYLLTCFERFRRDKINEGVVDYEAVDDPVMYFTKHRLMSWRYIGGLRHDPVESNELGCSALLGHAT